MGYGRERAVRIDKKRLGYHLRSILLVDKPAAVFCVATRAITNAGNRVLEPPKKMKLLYQE